MCSIFVLNFEFFFVAVGLNGKKMQPLNVFFWKCCSLCPPEIESEVGAASVASADLYNLYLKRSMLVRLIQSLSLQNSWNQPKCFMEILGLLL